MANGIWLSCTASPPPPGVIVLVRDGLNGVTYSARWGGRSYGWQVISFPNGSNPAQSPSFWLCYQ